MRDYSFIRFKETFEDAKNLNESPAVTLPYVGQIQLATGESYLQITNSETALQVSNLEFHLVDECGTELRDITSYVAWIPFIDDNGVDQIVWEFFNAFEYWTKPVAIRMSETSNNDTWFTNCSD